MQGVADKKSTDNIEKDYSASANDAQPPCSVGCETHIMKDIDLGVPEYDAAG